jgi:hypothetical protein
LCKNEREKKRRAFSIKTFVTKTVKTIVSKTNKKE